MASNFVHMFLRFDEANVFLKSQSGYTMHVVFDTAVFYEVQSDKFVNHV